MHPNAYEHVHRKVHVQLYIHVKEHLVHRQGHVHIYVHIHKHEHAKTCVSILKNKHVHCTSYSTVGAGPNGCYVSYELNR